MERKPLREYKNVKKIRISTDGKAEIIGESLLGVENVNFVTTAVHGYRPPKTSITVEENRTIIEFGDGEPEPATCRVWSSPWGPIIGCNIEKPE